MKAIQGINPLQIFIIIITLSITFPVMSDSQPGYDNALNDNSDPQNQDQDSALKTARIQLEKAFESYQQKDIKQTKAYLQKAKEWLTQSSLNSNTEKVKFESEKLAQKIENFYLKISLSTDQQENSLARFWHQTTSMIKRETDQLIHSYVEVSTTEKTLKHLLDAKMHLFTAEHDLFVSHDAKDATEELDKVINNLNAASLVAIPLIREKVESLSNNIKDMIKAKAPTEEFWKQNEILIQLESAFKNLDKAKQSANPVIKIHIDTIQQDIKELRHQIDQNNFKQNYDSAMTRLKAIIHEL